MSQPFKNNWCRRKNNSDYFNGLVWVKLFWGKDMDMKKWKILERPNKRQIPEQQESMQIMEKQFYFLVIVRILHGLGFRW